MNTETENITINILQQHQPVVLKNFLSADEVSEILDKVFKNYNHTINNYIPYRFSTMNWNTLSEHFKSTEDFKYLFHELFYAKFEKKLNAVLNDCQVKSISELSSGFVFNPFTIRVLQPESVDIHEHCENISIHFFDRFFKELSNIIQVYDQYSFLLMLQPSDSGGEIVVYDEYWKNSESVPEQIQKLQQLDQSGNKDHIKHIISLQKGDLLIFEAGKTWHKVNQAHGNKPRITLGGFAGWSKQDNNTLVFWS